MTRKRLRPAYTPDELARIYATPHDHRQWSDHHLRVAATIEVAKWLAGNGGVWVRKAADLSCGNGAIVTAVAKDVGIAGVHQGDLAFGHRYTGPIEETVDEIPPVDLFVCSETLEHLDDPDKVLASIRAKTQLLILSTPVDAWDDDNPEHYWAWGRADVEEMLAAAGFRSVVFSAIDFRPMGLPYCFGIWGCR